jgi:hypothetical protein
MAKLYSIGLGLLAAVFAFGQSNLNKGLMPEYNFKEDFKSAVKIEKAKLNQNQPFNNLSSRSTSAAGDTVWSNTFSDASEWTIETTGILSNTMQIGAFDTNNCFLQTYVDAGFDAADVTPDFATTSDGVAQFYGYCETDIDGHKISLKYNETIDLSAISGASLTLNVFMRKWYDYIYIVVSNSQGVSDTIEILDEFSPGDYTVNPYEVLVPITNFSGDADVSLEIIYEHPAYAGYFFILDDFSIIESPALDLVLDEAGINVNGIGTYAAIPISLADEVYGYASITNLGSDSAKNVELTVRTVNEDVIYDTISSLDDTVLNVAPGASAYAYTNTQDLYNEESGLISFTYILESDGVDDDFSSNIVVGTNTIVLTESVYARATWSGYTTRGTQAGMAPDGGSFMGANYFFYDSTEISSLTAVIDEGTSPDAKLVGKLFYKDVNGIRHELMHTDTFSVTEFNAFGDTTVRKSFIKDSSIDSILAPTRRFSELDTANGEWYDYYIIGIEMVDVPTVDMVLSLAADDASFHNIGYSNSLLAYDAANDTMAWYNYGAIPHVYMNIVAPANEDNDTTDTTDSTDTVDSSSSINDIFNTLEMYPNPAQDVLNITGFPNADVQVFNVIGALVMERRQVSDRVSLDVAALPKGNYIVKIVSDKGVATKKVVLGN